MPELAPFTPEDIFTRIDEMINALDENPNSFRVAIRALLYQYERVLTELKRLSVEKSQ